MIRRIVHLCVVVIGLLTAIFGHSAVEMQTPDEHPVAIHAYDVTHTESARGYATSERAPRTTDGSSQVSAGQLAVGPRSHGPSARPDSPTIYAHTSYDPPELFDSNSGNVPVAVAGAATTTRRDLRATGGALLSRGWAVLPQKQEPAERPRLRPSSTKSSAPRANT